MNSAYPIETSLRTTSLARRIRAAITRLVSREQPKLTREELIEQHEQRLLAERLLNEARAALYAARLF
jgi:hypothetical protein